MFKLKETRANLAKARHDKVELEIENDRLKTEIISLREINDNLRNEIEEKHLENYNQHRIILAIQKHISKTYGNYMSAVAIIKDIKKELSRLEHIDNSTN